MKKLTEIFFLSDWIENIFESDRDDSDYSELCIIHLFWQGFVLRKLVPQTTQIISKKKKNISGGCEAQPKIEVNVSTYKSQA